MDRRITMRAVAAELLDGSQASQRGAAAAAPGQSAVPGPTVAAPVRLPQRPDPIRTRRQPKADARRPQERIVRWPVPVTQAGGAGRTTPVEPRPRRMRRSPRENQRRQRARRTFGAMSAFPGPACSRLGHSGLRHTTVATPGRVVQSTGIHWPICTESPLRSSSTQSAQGRRSRDTMGRRDPAFPGCKGPTGPSAFPGRKGPPGASLHGPGRPAGGLPVGGRPAGGGWPGTASRSRQ